MSREYVTRLLSQHRAQLRTQHRDNSTETEVSNDEVMLQFDTMAQQVDSGIDLEKVLFTDTTESQADVEEDVRSVYEHWLSSGETATLLREKHVKYLSMALGPIPHMFKSLDASQPWIIYWAVNALSVMGGTLDEELRKEAAEKLLSMMHPHGGMGGGLGQLAHVAASYAGVLALALVGSPESWCKIDRAKTYAWLMSLKQHDGSFAMHVGGEVDTRAVYCALVVASLLDVMTPELVEGTAQWLQRCQTYEGGFGGVPWDEAHGGYSFCAVAALLLLGKDVFSEHVDVDKLAVWVSSRQMNVEGGFSGRTNKLVDGCYSFWVGGIAAMLDIVLDTELINRAALQNYILFCCQNEQFGGLRDKPSSNADFYHSNYVLLGLAVAQSRFSLDDEAKSAALDWSAYAITSQPASDESVAVGARDRLEAVNPLFGLPAGVAECMKRFFASQSVNQ